MIAAARSQKTGTPGFPPGILVLQRHFESNVNGYRAGIGKKDALKTFGHKPEQPFGQCHGRLMRKPPEHDVRHAPGLYAQGVKQVRVVVTVHSRPPRRHAVYKLSAVCQNNTVCPGASHGIKRRKIQG